MEKFIHLFALQEVYEEDCYAEILKDDIIKLDESSISAEAHTRGQEPAQMHHHAQGTAQRRIRLRVGKSKRSSPAVVGFPSTIMQSSKSTFFAGVTNSLVALVFLVFTLIFLVFVGWSQTSEVSRGCKL